MQLRLTRFAPTACTETLIYQRPHRAVCCMLLNLLSTAAPSPCRMTGTNNSQIPYDTPSLANSLRVHSELVRFCQVDIKAQDLMLY